ncbi:MAG TPA: hypothetical protein VMU15_06190 [Anaeromyxobacter sp.]|nr:hypothetical protein [Anaeromyxobacter sp.]
MSQDSSSRSFEERLAAIDGPQAAAELVAALRAEQHPVDHLAVAVQAIGDARGTLKQSRRVNWMLAMALPVLFMLGLVAHELGSM